MARKFLVHLETSVGIIETNQKNWKCKKWNAMHNWERRTIWLDQIAELWWKKGPDCTNSFDWIVRLNRSVFVLPLICFEYKLFWLNCSLEQRVWLEIRIKRFQRYLQPILKELIKNQFLEVIGHQLRIVIKKSSSYHNFKHNGWRIDTDETR
jgi:hypothetical protein